MSQYDHDNIDYLKTDSKIDVNLLVPISNIGMKLSASDSNMEIELLNVPEDVEIKIVKSDSKKFKIQIVPPEIVIKPQLLQPRIYEKNSMDVVPTELLYSAKSDQQYGFTDEYFSKGNWPLKIWQTIVAIFSWVCVIVPSFITISTFTSHLTNGKHGYAFWKYNEGIDEIWFLIYLLLFAVSITFIYATSMTLIQNFRREGTIEKWPTFDSIDDINKKKLSDDFMNKRFGSRALRYNIRYFEVQPDQNLEDNELPDYLNVDRG